MYRFCVMGNPIAHSLSPWIHKQFAAQAKLEISYEKIQPESDTFIEEVFKFFANQGNGLNITHPFKQAAYRIVSETSPRAAIAKSINTILIKPDGKLYGDNTDGVGLVRDITQNHTYQLNGKNIVIVGAGGAVRGILHPLLMESPSKITIVNRTKDTAVALAQEFAFYGNVLAGEFNDLKHHSADLVIDATPFGAEFSMPDSFGLSENSLCYTMQYGETLNLFLVWAMAKQSKMIADGLGMLVEQAAEAFYLWTGFKPESASVIKAARRI